MHFSDGTIALDQGIARMAGVHGATPDNSPDDAQLAPGDIAVGVVIGRASEYFDFFVYGIASVLVFPAVFLATTLFAFNFIGDGLRDALDPKDR